MKKNNQLRQQFNNNNDSNRGQILTPNNNYQAWYDIQNPTSQPTGQYNNVYNYNTLSDDIPPHSNPNYSNQQPAKQYQLNYTSNTTNNNNNVDYVYNKKQIIIQQPDPLSHLENGLEGRARKNFIKKVYMILGCQLLFTVGMCFLSYYSKGFLDFQIDNYWLMYVSLGVMLVTELIIFCFPAGRQHPFNIILLSIFTLAESYLVSFITAVVAQADGGAIVVVAACMTLFLVVALTLYAIFTPNDFTTCWGIGIAIIAPLIMLGIFAWIAWTPFLYTLYCSLGVILFGIYLVIDTQLIIGGRNFQLSMDDYVVGALILYIDIVQIFLYILMILGGSNN